MQKLFINGIECDLGNAVIAITKQSYNFEGGLEKRYMSYSNQITIPKTAKNNSIFKIPENIASTALNFEKFYDGVLIDTNTLLNCNVVLVSANNDFSIQLIDKATDFFVVTDALLTKLPDLDNYDFVFNNASYDLLKTGLQDSIWAWAAVSMHEERKTNNLPTTTLAFSRPFFSLKKIRSLIAEYSNWEILPCQGLDIVNDLILSSNHKNFFVASYEKLFNGQITVTDSYFFNLQTNLFSFGNTYPNSTTLRTSKTKRKFRIRCKVVSNSSFIINVIMNSIPQSTDSQTEILRVQSGESEIDFTTSDFKTSENSMDFKVQIIGNAIIDFNHLRIYDKIEEQELGNLSQNNLLEYKVKTYDNIPTFKMKDLVKNCWNMFGSFFTTDAFTQRLNVFNYNRLTEFDSIDWSEKIIKESVIFYGKVGEYGKTNYFSYNNDDTIDTTTGRGEFLINSEVLNDFVVVFKNIFSASIDVTIENQIIADFNIYDNDKRINTINPRILEAKSNGSYLIGSFNSLNGQNLIDNFYSNVVNSLNRTRLLKADFNLSKEDFQHLKFTQTVYISVFKSYFWVIKMENFISGKPTKCTLLKFK